jgi:hypothetical protein
MENEFVDELFCGDHVPDEMDSLCDWKKPIMELESRYISQHDHFRNNLNNCRS